MLPSATLLFGLLGLAVASPLAPRADEKPAKSHFTSKGFRLVVKLATDAADFKTPINNSYIASIHTGAGQALVGVSTKENSRVFYQNGTLDEWNEGRATIITDGGQPLTPAGLKLTPDKKGGAVSTASLDFGYGTPGVQLRDTTKQVYVLPATYIACEEPLAYYNNKKFIIIKQAKHVSTKTGRKVLDVPKQCRVIRLVPQCAKLNAVPKGSYASHEFALESKCYSNPAKLPWVF